MNSNRKTTVACGCSILLVSATLVAGCAHLAGTDVDLRADTLAVMKTSFKSTDPAKLQEVLNPDEAQRLCSQSTDPVSKEVAKRIEEVELKSVRAPVDGQYLGDWKRGEIVAQNGRGMQFSDKVGGENGGNCYACHQMTQKEISFGNLGPSLYRYGKVRGNSDAIVQYTWGKVYDSQAYNACSIMPRFGHNKVLSEQQMKDVVALLLDPTSPVNQ